VIHLLISALDKLFCLNVRACFLPYLFTSLGRFRFQAGGRKKRPNPVTNTGIAAGLGIGRSVASVCLFVRALTRKRRELSTPNLVHVYSIAAARHALNQRSKGQSHTVTKTVTVARLLVTRAATAYAGVGVHVDSTASVF